MNVKEFYNYIENPQLLNEQTVNELKEVIERYPYFQAARMLYLKNLSILHDDRYYAILTITSLYVPDRKTLFNLINEKKQETIENSNKFLDTLLEEKTPLEIKTETNISTSETEALIEKNESLVNKITKLSVEKTDQPQEITTNDINKNKLIGIINQPVETKEANTTTNTISNIEKQQEQKQTQTQTNSLSDLILQRLNEIKKKNELNEIQQKNITNIVEEKTDQPQEITTNDINKNKVIDIINQPVKTKEANNITNTIPNIEKQQKQPLTQTNSLADLILQRLNEIKKKNEPNEIQQKNITNIVEEKTDQPQEITTNDINKNKLIGIINQPVETKGANSTTNTISNIEKQQEQQQTQTNSLADLILQRFNEVKKQNEFQKNQHKNISNKLVKSIDTKPKEKTISKSQKPSTTHDKKLYNQSDKHEPLLNEKTETSSDSIIDNFLNNAHNISRIKVDHKTAQDDLTGKMTQPEDLEFISEPLAQLFYKQGYYEKSLKMYQKLILKYPEKSIYFTSVIEELKNKLNKS